ncbi:UNVERIFIED_CONTAM: hypothetical protein FKN15_029218 [Acipenser sinensis]
MVTEEQVVISLSGGAPWGFRLQGGAEHSKPLQVAKVRKRSKACRAGLREGDELLSINEKMCGGLSHAQAMTLIDSAPGTLRIRVRRSPAGFQSVVLLTRSPSPRIDRDYHAALRTLSPPVTKPAAAAHPDRSAVMSPTGGECLIRTLDPHRDCVTSPPDSEAYYGETDSDADTALVKQRRPKRRSPSATPGKPSGRASPEEISEMSSYDSTSDALPHTTLPGLTQPQDAAPGVARREILFQPRPVEEEEAGLGEALTYPSDGQGAAEVDSGFQEPPSVPLVSPERAKDASRLLFSSSQLIPMVGPVDRPVDEKLTTSYKDKARQAKLHRSESVQEKQVKEARSKCRTIASLLTAAPNPHSKGVLMFKKRRQRSKKYTLISFGSVEEDMEAGEEDEEEGEGAFPTSESEFDEEGFSAAPDTDPDWDSDYLDILERKKAPAHTQQGPPQGLLGTAGKGAQLYEQQQRRRAEENSVSEAVRQGEQATQGNQGTPRAVRSVSPAQPPPSFGLMNGDASLARHPDLVKSPPAPAPPAPPAHSVPGAFSVPAQQPAFSLLDKTNRTARPFTPGFVGGRSATAPVVFRPGKKAIVPTPHFPSMTPRTPLGVTSPLPPTPFSPPPMSTASFPSMTPRTPLGVTSPLPPTPFSPPPMSTASFPSMTPRTPLGVTSPLPPTPFSPPPMSTASFPSMTPRTPLGVTSPLPPTPFSPPPMSTASFPSMTPRTPLGVTSPLPPTPFSPPPMSTASFPSMTPRTPLGVTSPLPPTPFSPPPMSTASFPSMTPRTPLGVTSPLPPTPFSPPPMSTASFPSMTPRTPLGVTSPLPPTPFSPPPMSTASFPSMTPRTPLGVTSPLPPTPFSPPPMSTASFPSMTPRTPLGVTSPLPPTPFSPPPMSTASFPSMTPRTPLGVTSPLPPTPFSPPPMSTASFPSMTPRTPLGVTSPLPPTPFSPPPMSTASFPSMTPRTPLGVTSPLPPTPFSPPPMSTASFPSYLSAPAVNGAKPVPSSSTLTPASTLTPTSASLTTLPASAAPAFPAPFLSSSSEAMASREQRISVPAARTGILLESRRRGNRKSLFSLPEEKPSHSPNPALLSLVQNLDEKPPKGATGKGAQLYEQQQRRRAEENSVSEAARQGEQATQGNQGTPRAVPSVSPAQPPPSFGMMNGDAPLARHPDLVKSPPAPAPPAPPAHSVPGAFSVPAQQPAFSLLDKTNRTARPFTPGFVGGRSATAPVVFRPGKKAIVPTPQQPAHAPTSASLTTLPASAAPAFPAPFLSSSSEAMASREQRISVPAARTGILLESRRRGNRKSLFSLPEEKPSHSPNPALLSLVQNLDEKPPKGGEAGFESGPEEDLLNLGAEACNFMQAQKHRTPPPVAPKPHLRVPEVPQMSGKGAELFARRQSRMDRFVVGGGAPGQQQQLSSSQQPSAPSPTPSLPVQWKYSSNIRAPPPIGYNPLLSPSCPPGAQKGSKTGANQPATWSGRKATPQKQGIRALDVMKRQPYQLNPAMFGGVGGSQQQVQQQAAPMLGSSLTPPRQIPVKATRVYEIKRFSTPTPMSAPTSHTPTVIVPRSATTLGEPLWRSDICSPPPPVYSAPTPLTPSVHPTPTPLSPPSHPAPPVFQTRTPLAPAPAPAPAPLYPSFQAAKQFKSAPELSPLPAFKAVVSSSPQGSQMPRRFQVSRIGNQANVWRPGSLHY